jgi:hypothetical protein
MSYLSYEKACRLIVSQVQSESGMPYLDDGEFMLNLSALVSRMLLSAVDHHQLEMLDVPSSFCTYAATSSGVDSGFRVTCKVSAEVSGS